MDQTNAQETAQRPTLLTVLCIISFIMGLLGLYNSVQTITKDPTLELEKARVALEQAKADLGSQAEGAAGRFMESAMEVAENAAKNAKQIGISGIVFNLLSLVGVWLMWNLRKNGFWLYTLAALAGIAADTYFLGGGLAAMLSIGFMGFFTVLFIILYAVNLKYMH